MKLAAIPYQHGKINTKNYSFAASLQIPCLLLLQTVSFQRNSLLISSSSMPNCLPYSKRISHVVYVRQMSLSFDFKGRFCKKEPSLDICEWNYLGISHFSETLHNGFCWLRISSWRVQFHKPVLEYQIVFLIEQDNICNFFMCHHNVCRFWCLCEIIIPQFLMAYGLNRRLPCIFMSYIRLELLKFRDTFFSIYII